MSSNGTHRDGTGRVDTPIVDYLYSEAEQALFVVTFVPDAAISEEPKEVASIPFSDVGGRQVAARLKDIAQVAGFASDIVRVTHRGGGDFTFQLSTDETIPLSDP